MAAEVTRKHRELALDAAWPKTARWPAEAHWAETGESSSTGSSSVAVFLPRVAQALADIEAEAIATQQARIAELEAERAHLEEGARLLSFLLGSPLRQHRDVVWFLEHNSEDVLPADFKKWEAERARKAKG